MRHIFPLFIILSCLLTFLPGCEPKEDLVQTSGSLEMGADTVLFDTVFTTIKTVTKRLWVYNRNSGAVKTDVSLTGTAGTTYSLIINGDAGASATGVTVRGKDSLLVLVRAVLGDNGTVQAPKQFLVTDEVHFRTNGTDQNVKLVAYGQNAYFHRADYITANTTWATDKPHVIINASRVLVPGTDPSVFGVLVGQGFTLTIPKGARIYSHAGAYLQVNGRLLVGQDFTPTDTVKATNPNIVRFQGDRLEPFYADVPGQWGGIVFSSTSRGNMIRYAEIKNANFGVSLLNTENRTLRPDLQLENTVIRNISGSNPNYVGTGLPPGGIVGVLSDITARNCLLTNCGEYAVLGYGGSFNFNFCTFANYTPSFHRETPSLSFYNALEDANGAVQKFRVAVTLTNSIVWGSYENELLFDNYADYATNSSTLDIHNNLLRTLDYQAATNSTDKPGLGNPVLTNLVDVTDPLFKRTALISNVPDYRLQDTSPAKSRPPFGTSLTIDLLNLQRPPSGNQALGAYK